MLLHHDCYALRHNKNVSVLQVPSAIPILQYTYAICQQKNNEHYINYFVLQRFFNINRIATPAKHMILIIAMIFVSADVGTIILRTLVNVAAVLSVTLPEALLLETI